MAKIKCPECGSEIDENVKFCPNCGYQMAKGEEASKVDKEKSKTGSKKPKKGIIAGIVVVATAAIGIGVFIGTADMRSYNRAVSLMNNKEYQKAASEFQSLDGYKDSEKLSNDANYDYAKQELKNGNYEVALKKFAELGTYKDSANLLQSGNYQYAEYLMNTGEYDKAADIFKKLNSYKDSNDRYLEAVYNSAKKMEENGDYAGALVSFQKISSYEDSETHIAQDQHLADIQNDKTPPVISGITDGDEIDIDMMSGFNMLDYLKDKVHITDNVSGNISNYDVSTNADGYNPESGLVDTSKSGPKPFKVSAKDEAGNVSNAKITVNISNVIGISADNPNPVIYHDANYLIKASTITTGDDMYHFKFSATNNSEKNIYVDVTQANVDEESTWIQTYGYGNNDDMAFKNRTTVVDAGGVSPTELKQLGLQNFNKLKLEITISDSDSNIIGTVNISVPRSMMPS